MINYLLGFIFLLIQSINDLKTYEIDPRLCYFFGFFGILYHFLIFITTQNIIYLIYPIFVFLLMFFILYVLWSVGIIGGGDLKVLSTLSLITPCFDYNKFNIFNIIPLDVFLLSFIISLPYAILYTLSLRPLKFWLLKLFDLKNELKFITILMIVFFIDMIMNVHSLFFNLILIFLFFKLLPEKHINYLFILFLFINLVLYLEDFLYYFITIILFLILILYLKNFIDILKVEKDIDSALGEISNYDYFLINGKIQEINPIFRYFYIVKYNIYPIVESRASGLTKQDIENLKKYGIKKIWVKKKIPYIPTLLISYVLCSMMYFYNIIRF